MIELAQSLTICDREPIHVPGAVQYGLLLVVDPATEVIAQAAGDPAPLFAVDGALPGRTVQEVLGMPLAALLRRAEADLTPEPAYLGTVGPFGDGEELNLIAHEVQGLAVLEVEPAARSAPTASTLANIRSITEHIGRATTVLEAAVVAARHVRRVTGYDRVLIYRFLPDGSGSVIAETRDDRLGTFLNHRFPAADIPKQARELYRRNTIRVIPDVGYSPRPLTPPRSPATGAPLDMSHCILRSVSPLHVQYLKNMGVGAALSVSLLPHGDLWGLIACHNATPRPVPYDAREMCRHIGEVLSQQIRAREEADSYRIALEVDAARDRVMRALVDADDPGGALLDLCAALQGIVLSHGLAIAWKGRIATAGHVPSEPQIRQVATWLGHRLPGGELLVTHNLAQLFPAAAGFASSASGLLAMVLPDDDPMILMWFRAEQVEEINWAGNPHKPFEPGTALGELNPRRSFATWKETVTGCSRPWEPVEVQSAETFSFRAAFVLRGRRVRDLNVLLREANEQLAALASTDGLTGIANRRAFDERLQKEWARAGRSCSPLALVIIDLDFFKQYNDQYGHLAGDDCLRQVAQVLRVGRRSADLAARTGGEEFSLLLPDTDIDGAAAVAESVRARIEGLRLEHAKSPNLVVTASLGAAAAAVDTGMTANDLVRAADAALYEAKGGGRNQVMRARWGKQEPLGVVRLLAG